jgi:hypothetical protein
MIRKEHAVITIKMANELVKAEDEKTARWFLRSQKVKMSQVTKDGDVWTVSAKYTPKAPKKLPPLDPNACREAAGWE